MDRRTFTGLAAASLISAPALVSAQSARHVTIVGAGAAGLTAAYHLARAGIQIEVLEASQTWGGRMKRLSGFADVPLDLGAEWVHDDPEIFGRMLGFGETDLGVETIIYQPQTYQFWNNGKLNDFNMLRHGYQEVKFRDTTWYGFFERFVLPFVREHLFFGAAVAQISKSGSKLEVRLSSGQTVETDVILVTVPLSVLQREQISFLDGLAPSRMSALQNIDFGAGFKAFLKFDTRFYPDMLFEGPRTTAFADTWAEKVYYDAAFGKPTRQNILGLFTVSDAPLPRAALDDAALLNDILSELTAMFGPVVGETYLGGVVQNWSRERFIMGSYSMENESDYEATEILAPVEGRVFFAGEVLGEEDGSTVQGAAFSAQRAVAQILAR